VNTATTSRLEPSCLLIETKRPNAATNLRGPIVRFPVPCSASTMVCDIGGERNSELVFRYYSVTFYTGYLALSYRTRMLVGTVYTRGSTSLLKFIQWNFQSRFPAMKQKNKKLTTVVPTSTF
jgi:hypothetical protein